MDMKFSLHIVICATILSMLASCENPEATPRPTIPLVKEKLASQSFRPASADGGIYLVGEPSRVLALRERFINCDLRDNATGRFRRDSLPDFAGETFCCVLDSLNMPYGRGDDMAFRETAVWHSLVAQDSVLHVSPYDMNGMALKVPAKIMIFASPLFSNNGIFDVDTLAALSGKSFPVSSPLDAACARIFNKHKGNLNIGVISRTEDIASGAYSAVIQRYAHHRGDHHCNVVAFECEDYENALKTFLDKYMDSGNSGSLNALIVDDPEVPVPEMLRDLKELTSVMSSESLLYSKIFADRFEIIDAQSSVVQWCYHTLRDNHLFTHNIAYPLSEYYYTAAAPDGLDSDAPFMMIAVRNEL